MQTEEKTTKPSLIEKEYREMMKGYRNSVSNNQLQVIAPNDMFVKFSLYVHSPITITSTNTSSR